MTLPTDPDILTGFLDEAYGYLPATREGILRFRADPSGEDTLTETHRCLHTIKGAASMVGLTGLSHIAYQVEEAVEEMSRGHLPPTPETFDGLDFGVMAIEVYLDGVKGGEEPDEKMVHEAVAALRQLRGLPASDDPSPSADPLPAPNFNAFDTAFDLPALKDSETVVDGELPVPDFGALPDEPTFDAEPPQVAPPEFLISPSASEAAGNVIPPELLEVFRLEAEDHLRVLTSVLPLARKEVIGKDQWQDVRRAAHTLKGAAAMVGFAQVTTLAHRMEDLLDLYFEGERGAVPAEVDLLLASADAMEDAISGRPNAVASLITQFDALQAAPTAAVAEVPLATAAQPVTPAVEPAEEEKATARRDTGEAFVRVPLNKLNDIVKLMGELLISRTAFEQRMSDFHRLIGELDPSTKRLRRASGKLETGFEASALAGGRFVSGGSPVVALAGGGSSGSFFGGGGDGFDELEFDRYTEFHLISRELAETTNDIQTLAGELGYLGSDFDGHLTRQTRLGSEIEDKLMRLRMVPLSTATARLQRTVRNAAEQTKKAVELVLVGERTGLDKSVLEAMYDPLLHLLRNGVDHGLELPEVRRALGKSEAGTITLTAGHEGSQVILTIADDGRGIDPERVRARAVEFGLLSAEAAGTASDDHLYSLLFVPGFSTKAEVSELSGRGVGLDVVKSKVEALKGTVSVSSAVGRGTTFVIRLPMTLAVTRALLVKAHKQTFAIPLDAVEQILRFEEAEVQQVGGNAVLKVGERVMPVAHLGRLLNLSAATEPSQYPPVLIVKVGDKRLAVVVDHLLGGREVVIKALGAHLKKIPAVSGATLMGDGSVVLILNPAEFVRLSTAPPPARVVAPAGPVRPTGIRTVLIVDDSPSVRRVLTTLVERSGWTAVTCKDGLEALETLQRGQVNPDVVLSDIEMPRMDGYELLSTVRSMSTHKKLPVVMITSRSADKHRKRAMDLGASAYVTKPYQDESLVDLIRQLTPHR